MNVFNASLPFSYWILALIFFLGIGLTTIVFGIITSVILIICIYCEIIHVTPIIDAIEKCVLFFNPVYVQSVKSHLRESLLVEYEDGSPPEGPHLFLFHPHGVISVTNIFHVGTSTTDWLTRPIKGVVTKWLYWLPFAKEILQRLNAVSADYNEMKSVLEKNESLSLTLGGVKEIFYSEPNTMKLSIKNKMGAFRLALETGTPLVPVLSYGENELFEISKNPLLMYLQRILIQHGACLPIPTIKSCQAWFKIPWAPLETPIRTVVGSPIKVAKVLNPTSEQIVALRETYFVALKGLYKRTKPETYKNDLEIV